ncbi:hypothetical protein SARC_11456 [Sphaeroforma arctica JP610]|uniref:Uncharacterized protein n=1 Tax=Sphaeroforma arctica JP610 TaxID=667725 RepID=A0A0L0FGY6_9EUKA|nr:hypothetical protein SARC_11456 [Sphaeroforma arctica JP610]KNC76032.1 hypothetical protein SARC_11456 [Sphaeroforma arctica JP610]|eukprot:XP_014149934.1 hypothetical protein SARC_11456 [Sphaeroforma arctica JP610]
MARFESETPTVPETSKEEFERELKTLLHTNDVEAADDNDDFGADDDDADMLDADGATVDNDRAEDANQLMCEILAKVCEATGIKLDAQLNFDGKAALQEALIEVCASIGARNPDFASHEFRSQMMEYGGNETREPFVDSLPIGEDHILLLVVCQENESVAILDFI